MREFPNTTVNQTDLSISHTVGYNGATKKRDRKLTAKGLEYELSLLRENLRLEARLSRKAAGIEDLLCSSKNFITVKEELDQYDDVFRLIIQNHEEHFKVLKPEEQANEKDCFEDVDQRVFIFKQKVRNWLKDAEDEDDKKPKSSKRS